MFDRDDTHGPAGRVLVVCTGNVCRSPYLERRLRAELAGSGIQIVSAGTDALIGNPMEPAVADRLVAAGGEPGEFRARQLEGPMVRAADLVLCATREHRRAVVRLEPKGLRRTFAVLDFADLMQHMPPGPPERSFLDADDATFVQRVVSAAALHRDEVHARLDGDADVIDPYRRGPHELDKMVRQLEEALAPIVQVLCRVGSPAD